MKMKLTYYKMKKIVSIDLKLQEKKSIIYYKSKSTLRIKFTQILLFIKNVILYI